MTAFKIKKGFIIGAILAALLLPAGCDGSNEYYFFKEARLYEKEDRARYAFDVVQEYNGDIYFIHPGDGRIYRFAGESWEEEPFSEYEAALFCFTKDRMISIDAGAHMTVMSLPHRRYQVIECDYAPPLRNQIGFGYRPEINSVVYDGKVVYLSESGQIMGVDLENNALSVLYTTEEEVLQILPYRDYIFFTESNKNILDESNTIKILDVPRNKTAQLKYEYVFNWRPYEDFIYYITDYSLYRWSIRNGSKELIIKDSGIFEFEVADGVILCDTTEGFFACDEEGGNRTLITPDDCVITYAGHDIGVYLNCENHGTYAINLRTLEQKELTHPDSCLNVCVIGDKIFLRYGKLDNTSVNADPIEAEGIIVYDEDFEIIHEIGVGRGSMG